MALLIKRNCGYGADFNNYTKINKVFFHLDLKSQYKPSFFWVVDLKCYLNKESREIEVFKKSGYLGEDLTPEEYIRYLDLCSREIKSVTEIQIEIRTQNFILKNVTDKKSLFKYFYEEIQNNHLAIFGVRRENESQEAIVDKDVMTDTETSNEIIQRIIKNNIKKGDKNGA